MAILMAILYLRTSLKIQIGQTASGCLSQLVQSLGELLEVPLSTVLLFNRIYSKREQLLNTFSVASSNPIYQGTYKKIALFAPFPHLTLPFPNSCFLSLYFGDSFTLIIKITYCLTIKLKNYET